MKKIYCILAADSGAARLYRTDGTAQSPTLVQELANPAGRRIGAELDSDRPGQQRNDGGGMHGLGGDDNAHKHRHESEKFARVLGKLLQSEYEAGNFTDLLIAAPPHFLGDLRHHLSGDCLKVLGKSVHKDLLRIPASDLLTHFS